MTKEIEAELPFSKNGWLRISMFKDKVNTQSASNQSEGSIIDGL